jgi:signal transduction histidine kinase/ActR/RegA family two-component response regulator
MELEIFRRAQEIQENNRQLRFFQAELESRVVARTEDLQSANTALQQEVEGRAKAQEFLRLAEEQLRQSQKMEAVGRLAGGIAHDFNNLLTVILSCCETASTKAPSRELDAIGKAAQRAASLTSQLLAFSRQQVMAPQVLDMSELIRNLGDMVVRLLREDIALKIIPTKGLWAVKADPGQIEQVLMNLIVNARDAMPDGGSLTIETSNIHLDEAYSTRHVDVPPGNYVLVCVSDTGIGMNKETQAHIFEPFFTTKAPGKGTGLGLATAFGTVKQSGGSILLYSEPGIGTTFKIYFPALVEGTPWRDSTPGGAHVHAEHFLQVSALEAPMRILLVEDEDQVRTVVRDTLTQVGYQVTEATNGEEAMALLEASDQRIDLLLTDVIMSGMNGRRLSELLHQRHPDAAVLFMSGYTDDAILRHGVLDAGVPFLQKPFTPSVLRGRVSETLCAVTSRRNERFG